MSDQSIQTGSYVIHGTTNPDVAHKAVDVFEQLSRAADQVGAGEVLCSVSLSVDGVAVEVVRLNRKEAK